MLLRTIYIIYSAILLAFFGCGNASFKESKEMKLKISHYKVPCVAEGIQLCYLVSKNGGAPEYFYDAIEGFNFTWGFNYEISVEQKTITSPATDGSSFGYKLKKILKKEKAKEGETFELPVTLDHNPLFEFKNETCMYAGEILIKVEKYSCADAQKASIGVFRHHDSGNGLVLVALK